MPPAALAGHAVHRVDSNCSIRILTGTVRQGPVRISLTSQHHTAVNLAKRVCHFFVKMCTFGLIVPTHVGLEVCRVVVFGLARHCQPERAGSWNINRDFEYGPSTPSTTLALAPGGRGLHRAAKGGGVGVRASGSQTRSPTGSGISRGAEFAGWALGSRGPMADAPALAAMRLPRSALARRGQLEGRWMLPVRSSFRACPKHNHHARPGGNEKETQHSSWQRKSESSPPAVGDWTRLPTRTIRIAASRGRFPNPGSDTGAAAVRRGTQASEPLFWPSRQ